MHLSTMLALAVVAAVAACGKEAPALAELPAVGAVQPQTPPAPAREADALVAAISSLLP